MYIWRTRLCLLCHKSTYLHFQCKQNKKVIFYISEFPSEARVCASRFPVLLVRIERRYVGGLLGPVGRGSPVSGTRDITFIEAKIDIQVLCKKQKKQKKI